MTEIKDTFDAKYKEAMTLVKSYVDYQDGVRDDKIKAVEEQLKVIGEQQGAGGSVTLLNKLNEVISFLTADILAITKSIFVIPKKNNDGGTIVGNGDDPDGILLD